MNELILIKMGELVLKGLNRHTFEEKLVSNIRRRLKPLGKFDYWTAQSAIYITPMTPCDLDLVVERLSKIFGIAAICKVCVAPKNMHDILEIASQYLSDQLQNGTTFKVLARRSDKTFPLKSPEIASEAGGYFLEKFPNLVVDVHKPKLTVCIEIRDNGAYIHAGGKPGAGGLPIGTSGRCTLLISGGIDSPVAGYMTAKRGVEINAVHFFSYPYTSEQAKEKVIDLLKIVSSYSGRMNLFIVPFTKIQTEIKNKCAEDLFTLIMRRFMMKIACRIAKETQSSALVTGESIGQVASQTLSSLVVTDAASDIPVFRPVIGMDKEEIITIARKIGTFETSILPFEDCCTIFTPKHPKTRPNLEEILAEEENLAIEELIEEAFLSVERMEINQVCGQ